MRVLKNGDEVGSYWLPKGGYKLAIEAQGEKDAPSVLQDVIMLHLPKLPVSHPYFMLWEYFRHL